MEKAAAKQMTLKGLKNISTFNVQIQSWEEYEELNIFDEKYSTKTKEETMEEFQEADVYLTYRRKDGKTWSEIINWDLPNNGRATMLNDNFGNSEVLDLLNDYQKTNQVYGIE